VTLERERRLRHDYALMIDLPRLTRGVVQFTCEGDPPERYVVTYRGITGLVGPAPARLRRVDSFHAEFVLPARYPAEPPLAELRERVFHPNVWPNRMVCIDAKHWAPRHTLARLVVRVGRIIQYQDVNLNDPANVDAARWAAARMETFPVDGTVIQRGDPDGVIEVTLESDDDDEDDVVLAVSDDGEWDVEVD
jgi:hypothetical protein